MKKLKLRGRKVKWNRISSLGILLLTGLPLLLLTVLTAVHVKQGESEAEEAFLEQFSVMDTVSVEFTSEREQEDGEAQKWTRTLVPWYDEAAGCYYVFLPASAQGATMRILFDYASAVRLNGEDVTEAALSSEDYMRQNEAAFYDREGQLMDTGLLTFCYTGKLPSVFITTDDDGMDFVHENKENETEGMIQVVSENGLVEYEGKLQWIRGRGNTTWNQEKKPYSIKLEERTSFAGLNENNRFELLANFYDGSHMRNKIIYDLAAESGLAFSPQTVFVDLYLNGVYNGLYQVSGKIKVDPAGVNIRDLEKETAAMNDQRLESYDGATADVNGITALGTTVPREPFDKTGGYLLVMEDYSRFKEERSRFMTARDMGMVIKSPSIATVTQAGYIASLVQEMEDAICSPDGKNPQTGKDFTEYIDLGSWVRKYLMEEIAKNSDAASNSQYFYKYPDEVSGLIHAGPVWDYDNALGHTYEEARNPEGLLMSTDKSNQWYRALYGQERFREELVRVWKEVVDPLLTEWNSVGVDALAEQLRWSASADELRWKNAAKDFRYVVCEDYDAYVAYLKDFLIRRQEFLKAEWQ